MVVNINRANDFLTKEPETFKDYKTKLIKKHLIEEKERKLSEVLQNIFGSKQQETVNPSQSID